MNETPVRISDGPVVWGSDVVADTIRALGYRYIALVPGSSFRGLHDSIVNHLGNHDPSMIVCLHEAHAVAIADGFSRVANEPMAVALHANVGVMNASMMIFNAWCDRRPMLIIGATGPADAHKRRPWIDWIHTAKDQGALIRNYVKWDDQPTSAEAAIEAVLRADQISRTAPHGPVYVCLEVEMQETALDREVKVPAVRRYAAPDSPAASADTLKRVIDILRTAKSPVLLFGRGSREIEAWDNRIALAEALGAVVMTTMHNASAFPTEHKLHVLAPVGERPDAAEAELLKGADVVLSLDWHDLAGFLSARCGGSQTQTPAAATIMHCSLDGYLANGWSMDHQALAAADVRVLADPDSFVAQLLAEIRGEGSWTPLATAADAGPHWALAAPLAPDASLPFNAEQLAFTASAFARDRDVTFARLSFGWPRSASRFTSPLDFLGKDGGGAVGTGPGHTVGAALALRDSGRLTIGVMGDGDYLMGVNALWTASNLQLPMMIVVANNRSYFNDEIHQERMAVQRNRPVENKGIGQRLENPAPDLIGLARAQGFEGGEPVTDVVSLRLELEKGAGIVAAGGRYIIDARIIAGYSDK
ncbi:thiamine pyrophosphate-dependent enzyme [Neorhizobium sp. T786]|uniref:thiamine pyrophosphate-binding protein n=1 Tax=Pseudorhizobium xiangyangii TaxID=2883104 RepID=UPI001CFF71D9|nr:thiamine pyrophosphate-binding protein [Neorhizobium xiangyangii]MCB5204597.1 thiamine pyrophosphate-dependent enzyme [Neorhizobium xiangyangii]